MGTVRRWIAVCCFALMIAVPAASQAAVDAPYKGWGYGQSFGGISAGTVPVTAWKWTTTGWVKTSFDPGTSFWLHPFGSGWHWGYREGAWYALRDDAVSAWSCSKDARGAMGAGPTTSFAGLNVYRYNSTSQLLGVASDQQTLLCTNSFANAQTTMGVMYCMAIGCGPGVFMLVKTHVQPACLTAVPRCLMSEPAGGWPEQTGYVSVGQGPLFHLMNPAPRPTPMLMQ